MKFLLPFLILLFAIKLIASIPYMTITWQNPVILKTNLAGAFAGCWTLVMTNADLQNTNGWGVMFTYPMEASERSTIPETLPGLNVRLANSLSPTNVVSVEMWMAETDPMDFVDLTNSVPNFNL